MNNRTRCLCHVLKRFKPLEAQKKGESDSVFQKRKSDYHGSIDKIEIILRGLPNDVNFFAGTGKIKNEGGEEIFLIKIPYASFNTPKNLAQYDQYSYNLHMVDSSYWTSPAEYLKTLMHEVNHIKLYRQLNLMEVNLRVKWNNTSDSVEKVRLAAELEILSIKSRNGMWGGKYRFSGSNYILNEISCERVAQDGMKTYGYYFNIKESNNYIQYWSRWLDLTKKREECIEKIYEQELERVKELEENELPFPNNTEALENLSVHEMQAYNRIYDKYEDLITVELDKKENYEAMYDSLFKELHGDNPQPKYAYGYNLPDNAAPNESHLKDCSCPDDCECGCNPTPPPTIPPSIITVEAGLSIRVGGFSGAPVGDIQFPLYASLTHEVRVSPLADRRFDAYLVNISNKSVFVKPTGSIRIPVPTYNDEWVEEVQYIDILTYEEIDMDFDYDDEDN